MTCGTCAHHWQRWQDALDHWINDWNRDPDCHAKTQADYYWRIYRQHAATHQAQTP